MPIPGRCQVKTHLKIAGVDYRSHGQSNYEFQNQTACGYTRAKITTDTSKVSCFYCKGTDEYKERLAAK
jgi:hypothetical protein